VRQPPRQPGGDGGEFADRLVVAAAVAAHHHADVAHCPLLRFAPALTTARALAQAAPP
jgi:hypothetical protein